MLLMRLKTLGLFRRWSTQVVLKPLFLSSKPMTKRCVVETGGVGGAIGGRVILRSVHHQIYICPYRDLLPLGDSAYNQHEKPVHGMDATLN